MTEPSAAAREGRGGWKPSFQLIQGSSVLILLLALCVVSALETRTFLTWQNLVHNLLTSAAYVGIIACGMTFVMVAGGFDLSVGSNTAVCSVVAVLALQGMVGHTPWVAIAVAVLATAAAGALLGAANGVTVSYVGVNPFVTTLSTMWVFRGIALILTQGGQMLSVPLTLKPTFRLISWGKVTLFGSAAHQLTVPILVFLGVFIVCLYILRFTRFGHYVYAVGGNEQAAWLAGINTSLVKAATYAICGLTCAIAAVVFTAMANTAGPESHMGLELIVIASVIVGGTPLGGGSGGLLYTLIGLLFLKVTENLLPHFGIGEEFRNIVRGGIILVVVTIDVLVRGTGRKGRR